ncbi:MAG: hypothetical protein KVP17_004289 [Porospora cf. gigantea B]|uniref:uncharacterized protein n=1 Tax=Porospora cf. gigantea B TaxID=2853592 RepID=UPI003571CB3F|nr:MAG: hypothetical protein KVP17_004289 [Porospora cf. gigantea B]
MSEIWEDAREYGGHLEAFLGGLTTFALQLLLCAREDRSRWVVLVECVLRDQRDGPYLECVLRASDVHAAVMDACKRLDTPVRPTPDFCMAVVNHLADKGVLMKLHDEGSVLGAVMLSVLAWTPFISGFGDGANPGDEFTTPFVFRAFAVQAAQALLEDRAVWRGSEEEDPLGVVRDQKIRLVRLAELKRVLGQRDLPPEWITAVVREVRRLPKVMFVGVNHEEVLCHGDGVITANKDVVKAQLIQVSSIRCINQALRDLNRRHSRARENLDTYTKTQNEKMVILQLKQVKMIEAESNKLECLLSRITDVVHRASTEIDLLHSTCENAINVLKKTVK